MKQKRVKVMTISGKPATAIKKVLDTEGILIYEQRSPGVLDVFTETKDQNLQLLLDHLNKGYEEYKRNHPDFAKVVEKEERKLKGNYDQKSTHCESCGEYLGNFDMCDECGRINK